ncbi:hypothetical protein B0H21DRAFT_194621 [Amylocystis lapponica]|nr:hypothetical protein B0H21DRAFT_194621 [Amylocystis lapponica]
MRAHLPLLAVLIPALAGALAAPPVHDSHDFTLAQLLIPRDGDEHSHGGPHAAPKVEFNETDFLIHHTPTPPSYWTHDLVDIVPGVSRHPGLMGIHIFFMSAAFLGALPAGIALRSVKHAMHGVTVILFYSLCTIGLAASAAYRKLTPDMYQGSQHGTQGWFFLLLAVAITALDTFSLVVRFFSYLQSVRSGEKKVSIRSVWSTVVLGREDRFAGLGAEYTNLVADEAEEFEEAQLNVKDIEKDIDEAEAPNLKVRHARIMEPIRTTFDGAEHPHDETAQWANDVRVHRRQDSYPQSAASERTLFNGPQSPRHSDDTLPEFPGHAFPISVKGKASLLKKIGRGIFATTERILVFAGFMQIVSGIIVYTGGCRGSFINICLAHLIKGGIFWCYGLVSFARYLGSFSELGWAWNRAPSYPYPTAEFTESLVIFVYGASNTWMERFGVESGSPYTTKQVQHISIAVMFWFAGALGMGIESKRVRRWLASGSTAAISAAGRSQEAVAEPPSYIASFNPFPAFCIGVTGAAMSAHFQPYLFAVQIHMLWGYLLSAFAVLRCLTYFFLWLSPPRSVLPSRPPTEALGSFFLACGGLMFMFSTEELVIAAMRQGHDDMMMFMNVGIAITCLAFCWTLSVVAFKGWLKSHTHAAMKFHSST